MRTEELDYDLPEGRIAQTPVEPRDSARLLVDRGWGNAPGDDVVASLPDQLDEGDVVVLNDTRVLPARVAVTRSTGGSGEVLLLNEAGPPSNGWWEALCRPSRKMGPGSEVTSAGGRLSFEMGEDLGAGRRLVRPQVVGATQTNLGHDRHRLLDALEADGVMPLPPYITEALSDPERYQTTYAARPGSAAAPTAGLHITERLLAELRNRGVSVRTVELVVGLDTFRPVTTEHVESHEIHTEFYSVSEQTWHDVTTARVAGSKVLAVGTTTVRALESVAHMGDLAGHTDLFITPGFDFRVVDRLMTNFHLPRSSLLALVEAFVGPRWRDFYAHALESDYRFLSFGDAMLLSRAQPGGSSSRLPEEAR
ncbi:MAG: tRNA preQ1(34) S-adenosylmethionine ribosyltransferase-isomerase QueA [Microthrixaceae bacterium]